MSNFQTLLAQHIAKELDVSEKKVLKALDSFNVENHVTTTNIKKNKKDVTETKPTKKAVEKEVPKTPESKITKKIVPSTKDAKLLEKPVSSTEPPQKSSTQNHTCQRIKRGQKEPCGKPFKKTLEVNGEIKGFCGTEKTGCYAAEINQLSKKQLDKEKIDNGDSILVKNGGITGNSKKQSNVEKSITSDDKTRNLLHNILKVKSMEPHSVDTKSNGKVYMVEHFRALCDPKDNEFYGILDEDGDTILPIHDEARRFLEGNNCIIRQTVTNVKTKYQKRDIACSTTSNTKTIANATVSSMTSSSDSESDSEETEYNTVINNVTLNIEDSENTSGSSNDSDTD